MSNTFVTVFMSIC